MKLKFIFTCIIWALITIACKHKQNIPIEFLAMALEPNQQEQVRDILTNEIDGVTSEHITHLNPLRMIRYITSNYQCYKPHWIKKTSKHFLKKISTPFTLKNLRIANLTQSLLKVRKQQAGQLC